MAIKSRFQTPADEFGNREDMDIITSSDAVMVGSKTLTERLNEISASTGGSGIIVSDTEPTGPCLWGEVLRVD